ncbi:hypothetical protein TCAP_05690, partial [Tolypocladium capitatum]
MAATVANSQSAIMATLPPASSSSPRVHEDGQDGESLPPARRFAPADFTL